MTDYRTIHRFMPALAGKHDAKTACGIGLGVFMALEPARDGLARADDGDDVAVSMKGEPFDCKRCRTVLELHHKGRVSV
jgi:hypothetical protein